MAVRSIPFEVRQQHELLGLIALEEKRHADAASELQQANRQDPRILYLTAVPLEGKGDAAQARELARKAAAWNGLNLNYAFVREKAKRLASA